MMVAMVFVLGVEVARTIVVADKIVPVEVVAAAEAEDTVVTVDSWGIVGIVVAVD